MKYVSSLFTLVLFFSAQLLGAEIDYYSDRTQTLKLIPHTTSNQDWIHLNWAQTDYIAQLLDLYPKKHLYFLARDGEYIYDLAVVLTERLPELRKRLHLINVSRLNKGSPKLHQYLIQNGFNDQLKTNEGVVFADTSSTGSIGKGKTGSYEI